MEKVALSGLTGFTNLTSPGVSLGAKLTGRVDADTVLQFLATQGQVQTVSNPQLTFVSGSNAEFRVGGKQRYISQVGQLTSSVSGTSSSGVGTNTVSTESIDTGLTVTTSGTFEGGVISALLELTTQDVVSLNPTTMESGVTVDLPETSERKVSTSIRVRPGDNLVLAGLVTSRDVNDRDGIPLPFGMKATTFSRDQLKNNELVVLLKPSVVVFAEKKIDPEAEKLKERMSEAISQQTAVVIDKDGTKVMQLPSEQGLQTPDVTAPYHAELMVPYEGGAHPVQPMPLTPSSDGTAIDGRMMQGGFSQAFRELSEPDDGRVVKR
jgi:type II secretory pathway component GspD/PulD (secretin)